MIFIIPAQSYNSLSLYFFLVYIAVVSNRRSIRANASARATLIAQHNQCSAKTAQLAVDYLLTTGISKLLYFISPPCCLKKYLKWNYFVLPEKEGGKIM